MERDRNRLLIIIASIAGVVILALGGLYIALDFIEEQQERQQLTHQQQPPQQAEDMDVIDIESPVAEQPPVQEEPSPPAQDLPVAAPEQLPAAGQQGRQIGLDEARAIAERHLQSRNIQALIVRQEHVFGSLNTVEQMVFPMSFTLMSIREIS